MHRLLTLATLLLAASCLAAPIADARVKPADYSSMVIALNAQAKANLGLAGGLGACSADVLFSKPNRPACFTSAANAWLDSVQLVIPMLKNINQDRPGPVCRKALTVYASEISTSIDGVAAYLKAARARKLTSDNLPGYDRVNKAISSKAGYRLGRDCTPGA